MKEKCKHLSSELTISVLEEAISLIKEEVLSGQGSFDSFTSQPLEELLSKVRHSNFCPLCGSPLRETPLDRVLWKAVNKPNPGGLFPSQSLEHAVEFLKLCKEKVGESYISVDKIDSSNGYYNNPMVYGWEVSIKATEFFSASLSKALTKALLWATTELAPETVESLIKEEES